MAISIWGTCHQNGKTEKIDQASSKKEAAYLAREYQLAFGRGWTVWCGRKDRRNPEEQE